MRLRTAAESVPGEQYKSELKARPCVRAGTLPVAASVLAEEFSGFLVDEMKPGAGEADDGRIGIGTGLVRRGLRKPMLHVRAQPWAFEKDMPAHRREYAELARRVTSVCLRSWGCPGRKFPHGRREAIAGDSSAELATTRLPAQHPLRRKRPPAEAASLFLWLSFIGLSVICSGVWGRCRCRCAYIASMPRRIFSSPWTNRCSCSPCTTSAPLERNAPQ